MLAGNPSKVGPTRIYVIMSALRQTQRHSQIYIITNDACFMHIRWVGYTTGVSILLCGTQAHSRVAVIAPRVAAAAAQTATARPSRRSD